MTTHQTACRLCLQLQVDSHHSRSYYEKRGDQEGGRSILRIYPSEDIVIVMLSNTAAQAMKSPVKEIAKRLF